MSRRPNIVAHADWSTDARKRWHAIAVLQDGMYHLQSPTLVGQLPEYFRHLLHLAGPGGAAVAGFDFPIGLPRAYAQLGGIAAFLPALLQFGHGPWCSFYEVAEIPPQISVYRPFYPRTPGNTCQAHLLNALKLAHIDQLRRHCELPTPSRNAACPLFWTLGGNQVGRAAISGWRDLLAPWLRTHAGQAAIWPFNGPFAHLVDAYCLTVVETYPKDEYAHLGFPGTGWSKRNGQHRAALAPRIMLWIQQHAHTVVLTPSLDQEIATGFGAGGDGEDKFDATIGLLAMLSVVLGDRTDGAPGTQLIQTTEGWIFGQQ